MRLQTFDELIYVDCSIFLSALLAMLLDELSLQTSRQQHQTTPALRLSGWFLNFCKICEILWWDVNRASWSALDRVSKLKNNTGVDWINKNFRFFVAIVWYTGQTTLSKPMNQAVLQVSIENSFGREDTERLSHWDLDRFGYDGNLALWMKYVWKCTLYMHCYVGLPLPDNLLGTLTCQPSHCCLRQSGKTLRFRPATPRKCVCRS